MRLATLTAREQMLVVAALAIVLGGGYGLLRYRPALDALHGLHAQTKTTEERLRTLTVPDEPVEDTAKLERELEAATAELESLKQRAAMLERRLAPAGAQEIKLKISDLAQYYGVRIRENESYKLPLQATETPAVRPAPPAATIAKAPPPATVRQPADAGPRPPIEMLERFNRPDFNRPLQRVSMEGTYAAIRDFTYALEKLPWQVTVAQLQLEIDDRVPPYGVPQPLRATLILAL